MRRVKHSSLEIVFHYRCQRADARFVTRRPLALVEPFIAKEIRSARDEKMKDGSEELKLTRNFFAYELPV
jgi:hypothetical protein